MPGVTGMEAAREIRSFDDAADIVFLTTSPGFAYESYGVRALEYLLKPVSAKLLFPLLDRLYQREQNPQDGLTVRSEGVLVRLPFSQLSYVEVMGKHLFFHMTDDSVHEVVGALKERVRSSCAPTAPTSSICCRRRSCPPPGSSPSPAGACRCRGFCTTSCRRTIWSCCFPGGTHEGRI